MLQWSRVIRKLSSGFTTRFDTNQGCHSILISEFPDFQQFSRPILMADNSHSHPSKIKYFVKYFMLVLLAHLSRRLTGELIGYPWIRRRPFTFSNIFSSETAWPIKAKFYVEPPWEGGTKVYINGPGHMTKMAATPIYGKNP